jgi:hypothetical protein
MEYIRAKIAEKRRISHIFKPTLFLTKQQKMTKIYKRLSTSRLIDRQKKMRLTLPANYGIFIKL